MAQIWGEPSTSDVSVAHLGRRYHEVCFSLQLEVKTAAVVIYSV